MIIEPLNGYMTTEKNPHTRRELLAALAVTGITTFAGCSGSEEENTPNSDTSEREYEGSINEFPSLESWETGDTQTEEKVAVAFKKTPYKHQIDLEAYSHFPHKAPAKNETQTVATVSVDYEDTVVDEVDGFERLNITYDPNELTDNPLYHRFLLRVTNTETENSKILADKRGRNVLENPFTDKLYVLHVDAPREFTNNGTIHRPVKYNFLVEKTDYHNNSFVNTRGSSGDFASRINGFVNTVTEEETQLAKELREEFFDQEISILDSLEYTTTVDASEWSFIDQESGEYTYDIAESPQVRSVVNHIDNLETVLDTTLTHHNKIQIAHKIFYNSIIWQEAAFDGKENFNTRILQPAELWAKGRGNCVDVTVSLASVLYKMGYEVGVADVYPSHVCVAVKLPREELNKGVPFQINPTPGGPPSSSPVKTTEDYVWFFVDGLHQNLGETLEGEEEYSLIEGTIREGTNKELY